MQCIPQLSRENKYFDIHRNDTCQSDMHSSQEDSPEEAGEEQFEDLLDEDSEKRLTDQWLEEELHSSEGNQNFPSIKGHTRKEKARHAAVKQKLSKKHHITPVTETEKKMRQLVNERLQEHFRNSVMNDFGKFVISRSVYDFLISEIIEMKTLFHGLSLGVQTMLDFLTDLEVDARRQMWDYIREERSGREDDQTNHSTVSLQWSNVERKKLTQKQPTEEAERLLFYDGKLQHLQQYEETRLKIPCLSLNLNERCVIKKIMPYKPREYNFNTDTRGHRSDEQRAQREQMLRLRIEELTEINVKLMRSGNMYDDDNNTHRNEDIDFSRDDFSDKQPVVVSPQKVNVKRKRCILTLMRDQREKDLLSEKKRRKLNFESINELSEGSQTTQPPEDDTSCSDSVSEAQIQRKKKGKNKIDVPKNKNLESKVSVKYEKVRLSDMSTLEASYKCIACKQEKKSRAFTKSVSTNTKKGAVAYTYLYKVCETCRKKGYSSKKIS